MDRPRDRQFSRARDNPPAEGRDREVGRSRSDYDDPWCRLHRDCIACFSRRPARQLHLAVPGRQHRHRRWAQDQAGTGVSFPCRPWFLGRWKRRRQAPAIPEPKMSGRGYSKKPGTEVDPVGFRTFDPNQGKTKASTSWKPVDAYTEWISNGPRS